MGGDLVMRANPENIWAVPVYLPYVQPALTAEAVGAAEAKIGQSLPEAYLRLLRAQNGGYVRFTLPGTLHDSLAGIGPHYPSLTEFSWDEDRPFVSFELDGLVPFDGDGHWWLCLDYRGGRREPAVTLADVEEGREERVAESFEAFVGMLRLRVTDQFLLVGVADADEVKRRLIEKCGLRFAAMDEQIGGFAKDLGRLTTAGTRHSFALYPNTVRRGFVRKEDERYAELKDVMPEMDDQFPGLPPGSWLVSVGPESADAVTGAFAKVGVVMRPLGEVIG